MCSCCHCCFCVALLGCFRDKLHLQPPTHPSSDQTNSPPQKKQLGPLRPQAARAHLVPRHRPHGAAALRPGGGQERAQGAGHLRHGCGRAAAGVYTGGESSGARVRLAVQIEISQSSLPSAGKRCAAFEAPSNRLQNHPGPNPRGVLPHPHAPHRRDPRHRGAQLAAADRVLMEPRPQHLQALGLGVQRCVVGCLVERALVVMNGGGLPTVRWSARVRKRVSDAPTPTDPQTNTPTDTPQAPCPRRSATPPTWRISSCRTTRSPACCPCCPTT